MLNFAQLSTLDATLEFLAEQIPPVVATDGKTYPFVGEKACRARLESSEELRIANAILMFHLQTSHEQLARETINKNRRGLMSSHAAAASKTIALLLAGGTPAPDMEYRVDGMRFAGHEAFLAHVGSRYAKQLSRALRAKAMADNPALAITAQMFSVK